MSQWILPLLSLQSQMESVRVFLRNLEGYFNSTDKKSLTFYLRNGDIGDILEVQ
jgi:hypothetical protein